MTGQRYEARRKAWTRAKARARESERQVSVDNSGAINQCALQKVTEELGTGKAK